MNNQKLIMTKRINGDIINHLKRSPHSLHELSHKLKVHKSTVRKYLKTLEDNGIVHKAREYRDDYDGSTNAYVYSVTTEHETKKLKEQIMELLETGPATNLEIAQTLEKHVSAVWRELQRLKKKTFVQALKIKGKPTIYSLGPKSSDFYSQQTSTDTLLHKSLVEPHEDGVIGASSIGEHSFYHLMSDSESTKNRTSKVLFEKELDNKLKSKVLELIRKTKLLELELEMERRRNNLLALEPEKLLLELDKLTKKDNND